MTEQPYQTFIVGLGCKRPCDFSGSVDVVEPTTGRVTGAMKVCKTCGSIAHPVSLHDHTSGDSK